MTCKHVVKCGYCREDAPGILADSRDGEACHCARMGKRMGEMFCGEPVLVGDLCYDHARACSRCGGPYDPSHEHVCMGEVE